MSLNSLASSRVARDVLVAQKRVMSQSASTDDAVIRTEDVQNALSALVEYVPAETIALYLAIASALPVLKAYIAALTPQNVYWGFVVLTPLLFAFIYAGKRKAQGLPRWPGRLPVWPMFAATIAFMSWGLTAPNRPYFSGEGGDAIVGLLAVMASTLLGVVARFVGVPKV